MTTDAAGQEPAWARLCGGLVAVIDGICRVSGAVVALAALGTVVLCFAAVFLRYALGTGLIWLQESYVWTHVAVIVLGAGYTMMTGGFVRVDILYARWTDQRRALSDMVLTILLLWPFLWVFGRMTWGFWLTSYVSDEGSLNPGGLPDLWLLKGMLLGFCLLISLQSLAFVLRGALVLGGHPRWALRHAGHAADQTL
jgi:TRAP-type mannitol/chloroaromatic compound transport system permease small subunit